MNLIIIGVTMIFFGCIIWVYGWKEVRKNIVRIVAYHVAIAAGLILASSYLPDTGLAVSLDMTNVGTFLMMLAALF
jgi:hypothetical protein